MFAHDSSLLSLRFSVQAERLYVEMDKKELAIALRTYFIPKALIPHYFPMHFVVLKSNYRNLLLFHMLFLLD